MTWERTRQSWLARIDRALRRYLPPNLYGRFEPDLDQRSDVEWRRLILLNILWTEGGHRERGLIARVEVALGRGCFGVRPASAFASDMQFIRRMLGEFGHRIRYRRAGERRGYWIHGRLEFDDRIVRQIAATVAEVSPLQAAIQVRLTPGERVWQGVTLSEFIVEQGIRRRMAKDPGLTSVQARRLTIETLYRLDE
ncbi:MAG: hypothetical protein EPO32_00690 [Anaerolineae bacterium]|nr:MAG: hypothetical protein EPO32_00690 [Anaerolineae bacterium]